MVAQDCLYTIAERGVHGESLRLIGSVRGVVAASLEAEAALNLLAAPATRIVTLTVSEKGYLRGVDGALNLEDGGLASELAGAAPATIYGFLREALRRRREAGAAGLSILSCDNLASNGAQLAALFREFLERGGPGLRRWVDAECTFPSSMVDRIVPAATPADLERVASALGVRDECAVITEPFRQWVIEDRFAGPRPRWEAGGAVFVGDLRGYEAAKLRMLNGAHSALAYLGLARGYRFVHEAIADADLNRLIRDFVADAAASLPPGVGPKPSEYTAVLIERFCNAALPHSLKQIAMDGSQKITQRWLPVLRALCGEGRACHAHLLALAAWIDFATGDKGGADDPMGASLRALRSSVGREGIAAALFGERGLFAQAWRAPQPALAEITAHLAA